MRRRIHACDMRRRIHACISLSTCFLKTSRKREREREERRLQSATLRQLGEGLESMMH